MSDQAYTVNPKALAAAASARANRAPEISAEEKDLYDGYNLFEYEGVIQPGAILPAVIYGINPRGATRYDKDVGSRVPVPGEIEIGMKLGLQLADPLTRQTTFGHVWANCATNRSYEFHALLRATLEKEMQLDEFHFVPEMLRNKRCQVKFDYISQRREKLFAVDYFPADQQIGSPLHMAQQHAQQAMQPANHSLQQSLGVRDEDLPF